MESNKIKKVLKRMVISIILILLITVIGLVSVIMMVQKKGEQDITTIDKLEEKSDVIIVLGAGVKDDGSPSDILTDRLKTAIEVYNSGICNKFILSGDHGKESYNEVKAMKEYIMDNCDVEEQDIFLDHAGFSTYDSIYRAKKIFEVKSAIIVTNEYHLPRALYLAEKMDINAKGVASDIRNYLFIESYKSREKLAQLKDFVYVNMLKPEPEFLGDAIPVSTSDGRDTNG